MIDQMLAAMDQNIPILWNTWEQEHQCKWNYWLFASMVEKRGATDQDHKDIASVFYNRLNQDPCLCKEMYYNSLCRRNLVKDDARRCNVDTELDSPYNIYKNTGLMPGPVDNPGYQRSKRRWTSKTDYLYFVANVENGEVFFAKTWKHNKWRTRKLTQASSN